MASTVGLQPNHYEVLGLQPTASQQDITRAFASAMSLFDARSMAAAAQMSLAFEVLRNPAKRRAYDRSLGFVADPDPRHWTVTASMRAAPTFIGSAWNRLTEEAVGDGLARPIDEPERPQERPAEPRLASFIASSLRDPRAPVASGAVPEAKSSRQPINEADAKLERRIEEFLAKEDAIPSDAGDRSFEWRRPALAVGGLVLIAGVIGTVAGLSVRDGGDPAPAGAAIPARHTPAKPRLAVAPPEAGSVEPTFDAVPQRSVRAAVPRARHLATPRRPESAIGETAANDQSPPSSGADGQPAAATSDPLAPAASKADPTAMPLPDKVVARTIDRIGYRCGEVAFTAAVADSPGSYKVTCSSGQSYQASPVRGRYHFRRLGSSN